MSSTSAPEPGTAPSGAPDHPTLLPALLVADPGAEPGRVRRSTRDWIVDSVCFLLAVGLGVLVFFIFQFQHRLPSEPLLTVDLVTGGLACVALWWRRRWPVTLAVVTALLGTVCALGLGAGAIALFTVAVHRRTSVTVSVLVLSMVTQLPYNVLHPDPTQPYWAAFGYGAAIMISIMMFGMMVRARRQLVLSLRERAHRAEAEQQLRTDQARRAERTRIAREMHDVLAHRISLLSTYAGALEFRPDAAPDEVSRAAGVIRASAHQALTDLREVIGVLREDATSEDAERPQPMLSDVPDLIDETRRSGMRVTLDDRLATPAAVPDTVGRSAYRIVQEGLTNARKHAPDTTVTVVVDGVPGDGVRLEVRNPMPVGGSSGIPGSGTGLVGLAERASLAGGRIEHGVLQDGVFRLRAWLPWPL